MLSAGFVPQVAVFVDGVNEFLFADGDPLFAYRLRNFMDGKSESRTLDSIPMVWAAHWLRQRWKAKFHPPQKAAPYGDPALLQRVVNRWLANKRMIESTAAAFGVPVIFVWQPVPTYKYDTHYYLFPLFHTERHPETWLCASGYPLMEELRAQGKLGPNVLWLADLQQDRREYLYVDSVHYNAAFSKEIAARICTFLGQSNTEPRGQKPRQ